MSGELVSQIAEVMREHEYNGADLGHHGPRVEYCICGWKGEGQDSHLVHQAQVLVDRLGLQEVDQYRSAFAPDDCDYDRARYETGWLPVGGQKVPRG